MSYYSFEISPEDQSEFDDIEREYKDIDDDIYKTHRAIGELETARSNITKELIQEIDKGKQLAYNKIDESAHRVAGALQNIKNEYDIKLNHLLDEFTIYADNVLKIVKRIEEI